MEWGLLIAILLLAAFLRLWRLEQMPPGLYHDEAYNGLDALSCWWANLSPNFMKAGNCTLRTPTPTIRRSYPFPPLFEGNYGREPLHIYLMACR
ncbi:MAG: hypothetical protein M5U34_14980 [Chloroflexi bacterium]|nr:hypothetical protein [Chloroflexota bacterium]